ncbi:MAG: flippase [Patescibacteria group bacterium]
MSLARSIAYNTLLQTTAKIVSTFFAILAFAMIARYLGTNGFGAYATITAFLQLFGIMVDMGLTVITIQMVSEAGADQHKNFRNLFTIRLLSGIVIYLIAPAIALLLPYPTDVKLGIAVMAPSFFLSSLIQISTARYQAEVKMLAPTIAEIASKIVLIAGVAFIAQTDIGLMGVLAMILANNAAQWLILVVWRGHWRWMRLAFDWSIWRDVFFRTWPIALSILCNVVYLRADTIILSLFRPQADVGIYGAAFRVLEVMMTLPIMFVGLTLSSFTRAWSQGDRPAFARYFQKTFDVMAITSFPLVVGTWFVGTDAMILVTGEEFAASGSVLKLLMIAVGAIFFGSLFGHLINIIFEQRRMLIGYAAVAILGLGAYIVFIPIYSYYAAAIITIATEFLVAFIGFGVFYYKTRVAPSLLVAAKAVLSSAAMGIFLYAFPHWHLAAKVLMAIVVYGAILFITGGLTKDLIRALIGQKR